MDDISPCWLILSRQFLHKGNSGTMIVCPVERSYTGTGLVFALVYLWNIPLLINSSTDFVEILRQANEDSTNSEEDMEIDIFGYTKNWETISRAYRIKHNYTCEKCGLHIDNELDRMYLHTHHINGNKTDNREKNLRCLCIRCHANVDDNHYKRLTTGANRIIFEDFCKKYRPD